MGQVEFDLALIEVSATDGRESSGTPTGRCALRALCFTGAHCSRALLGALKAFTSDVATATARGPRRTGQPVNGSAVNADSGAALAEPKTFRPDPHPGLTPTDLPELEGMAVTRRRDNLITGVSSGRRGDTARLGASSRSIDSALTSCQNENSSQGKKNAHGSLLLHARW